MAPLGEGIQLQHSNSVLHSSLYSVLTCMVDVSWVGFLASVCVLHVVLCWCGASYKIFHRNFLGGIWNSSPPS